MRDLPVLRGAPSPSPVAVPAAPGRACYSDPIGSGARRPETVSGLRWNGADPRSVMHCTATDDEINVSLPCQIMWRTATFYGVLDSISVGEMVDLA